MTTTPLPTVPRSEYLPPVAGTSHEKEFDGYVAPCEVCGTPCWWTARNPHGLCPCTQDANLEAETAA